MGSSVRDLRFYVFSTVFQSYQDDGRVIMKKAVCHGTTFTIEKVSASSGA